MVYYTKLNLSNRRKNKVVVMAANCSAFRVIIYLRFLLSQSIEFKQPDVEVGFTQHDRCCDSETSELTKI